MTRQVGIVRWRKNKSGFFTFSYRDGASGKQVSRTVKHPMTDGEAMVLAEKIDKHKQTGICWDDMIYGGGDISIYDVFGYFANESSASLAKIIQYRAMFREFAEWLNDNYDCMEKWGSLRREILQKFLNYCAEKGNSYVTIMDKKSLLQMLRNWVDVNYPGIYPDVTRKLKIPVKPKPKKTNFMPINDVLNVLYKIEDRQIKYVLMLCLFTGLRIREASNIQVKHINGDVISIEDTRYHAVKNGNAARKIPIMPCVKVWIDEILDVVSDFGADVYVFSDALYKPFVDYDVSKATRSVFGGIDIVPRNMRAVFQTLALKAGVDERYLERYCGHAPRTIERAHYLMIDTDQLREHVCLKMQDYYQEELYAWAKKNCGGRCLDDVFRNGVVEKDGDNIQPFRQMGFEAFAGWGI